MTCQTPAVPIIFSPRLDPVRTPWNGRILALGLSLTCLLVLVTAARLKPSPAGIGTHTALGLPDCQWLLKTGVPCFSCGMTTSFSWFARGNFVASFYVQPMGMVLAVLAVVMFWTSLYVAFTGRAPHQLILQIPPRYHAIPLVAFGIAAWAWKIFIHLHGIDGWPV